MSARKADRPEAGPAGGEHRTIQNTTWRIGAVRRDGRRKIECLDESGCVLAIDTANPVSQLARRRVVGAAANVTGRSVQELDRELLAIVAAGDQPQEPFFARVRDMHGREGEWESSDDPRELLERLLNAEPPAGLRDPIVEWRDRTRAMAIDLDPPKGEEAPERALVEHDYLYDLREQHPGPDYAWTTHHGGLRLIWTESGEATAEERAGAFLLTARLPSELRGWRPILQTSTRHPLSVREDGSRCGQMWPGPPDTSVWVPRTRGTATRDEIEAYYDERGWPLDGGSLPGSACPSREHGDGSSDRTVTVGPADEHAEHGASVRCWRCDRTWHVADLIAGKLGRTASVSGLRESAESLVHVGHMRHVLASTHPHVPARLREAGWRHLLRETHRERWTTDLAEKAASGACQLARSWTVAGRGIGTQ